MSVVYILQFFSYESSFGDNDSLHNFFTNSENLSEEQSELLVIELLR